MTQVWYRCGQRVRATRQARSKGGHAVRAGDLGTVIAGNQQAYAIRFDGQPEGAFVVCFIAEFESAEGGLLL